MTSGVVTKAWLVAVSAEMERRGWNARELSRRLDCDPSHISRLLSGQRSSSRYAFKIAELLGVPLPGLPPLDRWEGDWLELGRRLRALGEDSFETARQALTDILDAADKDRQARERLARVALGKPSDGGAKKGP